MAAAYLIHFPLSMDGKMRHAIMEEFDALSWETFPHLDPEQCTYSWFEAFWPYDSEPLFPNVSSKCTITKK